MANIIFLSFLLSSIFTAKAQQGQSIVKPGSLLTPTTNSSWLSPSGLYAFGFYKQGNGYVVGVFLIGIPQKTVVWTANRDNPPLPDDVKLNFTSDGRLVLQSTQGTETSIATLLKSATSASMLDSGNFVLQNYNNKTIWQSFDYPTDTLLATQHLSAFRVMYSSVSKSDRSIGIFRLLMQGDGNLVQYPVGTQVVPGYDYWSTSTNGKGNNVSLCLDDDAHLYLLNSSGTYLMNLTQGGYPRNGVMYLMRIDAMRIGMLMGSMRLYSHNLAQNGNRSVLWASTDDECDPKGICGLNGFCVTSNQDFDCICLLGFAFVNQSKKTSGCERNFTAESCEVGSLRYTMEAVPNTTWENANFSILLLPTKEDCIAACLGDYNCEAVLFKNGECNKQRLPLRFGRRSQSESNVALIKVGMYYKAMSSKKKLRVDILIICVSLVAFAFIVLAISGIAIYRNRVWAYKSISNHGNIVLGEDIAPRSFTYAELEKVTDGFKEELGRGAFGTVYKGVIGNDKKVVAVKRLDIKLLAEREREFQTEMRVIGRTHHKNLVRLLGYCHDGPNRLLVYEYMSMGHGCAKISDFGLAKLLNPEQTKTFTDIRGTRGYVAPEWHRKSPVTVKVDVYSFGVVLLEIICCRKNVDYNLSEEEAILEEWACHCFETGESDKLVNDEDVDKGQLERMIKVAIWCIQDEPSIRPSMKKVLLMLEGTVEILIPPSLTIVTTM
uniref:Receptor-like serine/threonine-protein kinase n=1 Tax=Fagus sylvatica TaxID=28930 RepID=A0A2N9F2N8_FAGSY